MNTEPPTWSLRGFLESHPEEYRLLATGTLLAMLVLLVFGYGARLMSIETLHLSKASQLEKVRIARSALEPTLSDFRTGRITQKQALEHARAILRSLVYEDEFGRNYFFMNTLDGTILVRPLRPEEEMVRKVEFRDAHGYPQFQEILPRLREHPAGVFLNYYFPNPTTGRDEEKLSCFMLIPELDVMIGTGGFASESARTQGRIMRIGVGITLGILALYLVPVLLAFRSLRRNSLRMQEKIQEREIAEAELLQERAKLADMAENLKVTLDSIGDALISTSPDLKVAAMNPVAQRLTGWSLEEAMGRPIQEVFRLLDPSTKAPLELPMARVQTTGESSRTPLATLEQGAKDTRIEVTFSCFPIRNHAGDIVGTVTVFRDITEENRNREELAHAQRMDAIGQLAGGVAHDFNNMLAGIMGIAEFLQDPGFPHEDRNQQLASIVSACQRAAELSGKLLAFARKGKIESTSVDLHGTIGTAISLLNRTIDKRVEIHTSLDAAEANVIGDTSILVNAFLNLGINAQHAMPEGGVLRFATRNVDHDEARTIGSFHLAPGKFLVAEITDTGCGIPPEHLGRIFEPYFTTKAAGKGTGLGLAAVYGIMIQHHGAIEVSSTPGAGTTFRLYFPTSEHQPNKLAQTARPLSGQGTLLLVEDEEIIRTTARTILEHLGYRVLLARDGEEGLEVFTNHQTEIDLVILDMIMPKMNGHECFLKIRKLSPQMPVLLASGFTQPGDLAELRKAGISGFLRKPFNTLDLSLAVKSALALHLPKGVEEV